VTRASLWWRGVYVIVSFAHFTPLDSGVRGPGTGLRDIAIDSGLFAIVGQNSILGLSHLQVTASPGLGDTDLLSSVVPHILQVFIYCTCGCKLLRLITKVCTIPKGHTSVM
jgi:hypothetical protein